MNDQPKGNTMGEVKQQNKDGSWSNAKPIQLPNTLWERIKVWVMIKIGVIPIIIAITLVGCTKAHYNEINCHKGGFKTVGGHSYTVDTVYRIELIHAEHCRCTVDE